MKNILIVSIILTTFVVSLLSCGDTSGPLDVSDPTASILTVTLEETDAIKDNETTVSSALSEECSDRSEVTIERNSKGGFQAHAVWTQCPDDNFAWYAIYRSDTPGIPSNIEAADTSVIFTSVSGTSWLDTGIIAGNTYYYAVRTVNEDDIDSWSNEDSVVVSAATPPSPSTLSGSYTGDDTFGQITLEWTECPDSDFYCYKLYRSESHNIENDPSLAEIVAVAEGSNNTNFEDNDVEGLTTYYYAVETINESQLSTWSNEVSVAIPDLTPLLTVFFIDPSHNNYYSGDVILLRTP